MITIEEAFCFKSARRVRGEKLHNFEELHSLCQVEEVLGNDLVNLPEGVHFPVPGRLRGYTRFRAGARPRGPLGSKVIRYIRKF